MSVAPAPIAAARPSASWRTASATDPPARSEPRFRPGTPRGRRARAAARRREDPIGHVRELQLSRSTRSSSSSRPTEKGSPSPKRSAGGESPAPVTGSPPTPPGPRSGRTRAPPPARSRSRRWRSRRRRPAGEHPLCRHGVLVDRQATQGGRDSCHGFHGHMLFVAPDGRARRLGGGDHLRDGALADPFAEPLDRTVNHARARGWRSCHCATSISDQVPVS